MLKAKIERGIILSDEQKRIFESYLQYCCRALNLMGDYDCYLIKNRKKFGIQTTAACLFNEKKIIIYCEERLVADVLRSIAHEATHLRQFEMGMKPDDKYLHFSSELEDGANELAGKLLNAFSEVMGYDTIYGERIATEQNNRETMGSGGDLGGL
jgi:hypothetical protein